MVESIGAQRTGEHRAMASLAERIESSNDRHPPPPRVAQTELPRPPPLAGEGRPRELAHRRGQRLRLEPAQRSAPPDRVGQRSERGHQQRDHVFDLKEFSAFLRRHRGVALQDGQGPQERGRLVGSNRQAFAVHERRGALRGSSRGAGARGEGRLPGISHTPILDSAEVPAHCSWPEPDPRRTMRPCGPSPSSRLCWF